MEVVALQRWRSSTLVRLSAFGPQLNNSAAFPSRESILHPFLEVLKLWERLLCWFNGCNLQTRRACACAGLHLPLQL